MSLALLGCAGKSTSRGDGKGDGASGAGASSSTGGGGGVAQGVTGGTGGGDTNVSVIPIRWSSLDKVDLLVVVDNSIGMGNKQQLLSESVPLLIRRLTAPNCTDQNGSMLEAEGDSCPAGSELAFQPIRDLHVGLITSSLGSHGGSQCQEEEKDDYAQLMASRRAGLSHWNDAGFLSWDPTGTHTPVGESDRTAFVSAFRDHIEAARENGCGYESSLEAMYRFLVDPEPPMHVTNDGAVSVRGPINETVLNQRNQFLRSDSAVIVVMLSDENDCSISDENDAQGWLVSNTGTSAVPFRMPRASSACAEDPNGVCCRTCGEDPVPGCPDNTSDSECVKGTTLASTAEDHPNLRCFKQRERFGVDLLYPTRRYSEALSSPTISSRDGGEIPNPLFSARNGGPSRDPSMVMLVGIVGVPWQDIAHPDSFEGESLRLLSGEELRQPDAALMGHTRWDLILGIPGSLPPMDPHMLEQIEPRPEGAQHPLFSGAEYAIASPASSDRPNAINGHEQNVVARDDLQYACTFALREPIPCDTPAAMGNAVTCQCNASEYEYKRPLCSYANGSTSEGVQEYDKAYPGIRQLEVLRGLGSRAVVGSICPKNSVPVGTPESDPNYGYNPIVSAIIDGFRPLAAPFCMDVEPPLREDGSLACRLVRADHSGTGSCSCDPALGEHSLTGDGDAAEAAAAMRDLARALAVCDGSSGVDCNTVCLCEIEQLLGSQSDACVLGEEFSAGFCYVDSGPLVAQCPETTRRLMRLPPSTPRTGVTFALVCDNE